MKWMYRWVDDLLKKGRELGHDMWTHVRAHSPVIFWKQIPHQPDTFIGPNVGTTTGTNKQASPMGPTILFITIKKSISLNH